MSVMGFDEALAVVLEHARGLDAPREMTRVSLKDALGRVLAEDVRADRDQPGFVRATRDGFAVSAATFSEGATLQVVGEVRAGFAWTGRVGPGEAVRIMTGAPLPAGVDAVAMVEFVEVVAGGVKTVAGRGLRVGENVVPRGAEAKAGQVVVARGTRVGAAEIALAAGCGCASLGVWKRPMVAIVATGDELVEVGSGEELEAQQIWNSNGPALAAMVAGAGGFAGKLAIARDTMEEVRERIAQGRMWDLMVLSGGVSMGEYDLVEAVLAEMGAEFLFTGVMMQPGKPVVFGRFPDGKYFFGLPGNPVSTQVTFHCFVEPFLKAMGGGVVEGPLFVQAALCERVAGGGGRMRLLPARLTRDRVEPSVQVVAWQGSGDMAANARANCYAVLPQREGAFAAGEVISVMLR